MNNNYDKNTRVTMEWSKTETTSYRATLDLSQIIPDDEWTDVMDALNEGQSLAEIVEQYGRLDEHEESKHEIDYDLYERFYQTVKEELDQ